MAENICLKRAREEKGLTRQQLAEQLGETEDTIGKIEDGVFSPSIELCREISRILSSSASPLSEMILPSSCTSETL